MGWEREVVGPLFFAGLELDHGKGFVLSLYGAKVRAGKCRRVFYWSAAHPGGLAESSHFAAPRT
jgi:hypothetical protein